MITTAAALGVLVFGQKNGLSKVWSRCLLFFLFSVILSTAAGPVVTVDKTEHVFCSVLSKQLWEKAA